MKKFRSFILLGSFGLFLAGCASTAHIEKDDAFNFNNYKTFAWVDAGNDSKDIKKNSLQEANVQNAVNSELEKAGWRVDKKNPDVLLKHDVLVEKTVKETNNPVYSRPFTRRFYNPYTGRLSYIYYPSRFMGYDNDQYVRREGTLTITMVDAKTDKVVWQGWSTDEVSNKNLTGKEIRESVKSIFRKFDVAKN